MGDRTVEWPKALAGLAIAIGLIASPGAAQVTVGVAVGGGRATQRDVPGFRPAAEVGIPAEFGHSRGAIALRIELYQVHLLADDWQSAGARNAVRRERRTGSRVGLVLRAPASARFSPVLVGMLGLEKAAEGRWVRCPTQEECIELPYAGDGGGNALIGLGQEARVRGLVVRLTLERWRSSPVWEDYRGLAGTGLKLSVVQRW